MKGQTTMSGLQVLLVITLSIIFLVVIVSFVKQKIIPTATETEELTRCKTSIDINARRLTIGGVEIGEPLMDIQCEKLEKHIRSTKENEIFQELAQTLTLTWDTMGKGNKKIFDDATRVFCLPRYAPITFTEPGTKHYGFLHYLATHPKGTQTTYYETLMNRPLTLEEEKLFAQPGKDFIDTTQDYAVIFLIAKTSSMEKVYNALYGAAIGGLAAIIGIASGGTLLPATLAIATGVISGGYIGQEITETDIPSLENVNSFTYAFGTPQAQNFQARLILLPYTQLNTLGCDELKVIL